jgi:flagellar L-ring protein precursor FlgH
MTLKPILPILCLSLLSACMTDIKEIGREPSLSPVGAGMTVAHTGLAATPYAPLERKSYHSLYTEGGADLFRDSRAMKPGDVLTVRITIDDQAKMENRSGLSRESAIGLGGDFSYDLNGAGGDGKAGASLNSRTSSRGQGSIDRAERIELSVAATIMDTLPNGNLLISGSQEVRVNQELRVLNVAGIVRPRDISAANTVAYDKIAEARVSYGGRGRGSTVQNPGWGQQLYNIVAPF